MRLLLPQVAQLHAAALAEDASVFAYDEVYDSLKESEKPKREEKKERKSKYIEGLLDKAKERNKEQDIIYERGYILSALFSLLLPPLFRRSANLLPLGLSETIKWP